MKYAIVSDNDGQIPEHVKGAKLVTYDTKTGAKEEHNIKTYLPFFYGLNTIWTIGNLKADYFVFSKKLRSDNALQKRGIKTLIRNKGTNIDQIIREIESSFTRKTEKIKT